MPIALRPHTHSHTVQNLSWDPLLLHTAAHLDELEDAGICGYAPMVVKRKRMQTNVSSECTLIVFRAYVSAHECSLCNPGT